MAAQSGAIPLDSSGPSSEFACDLCGAEFQSRNALSAHKKAHRGGRGTSGTDANPSDLVDISEETRATKLAELRAKRLKALREIDSLNPHANPIQEQISQLIQIRTLQMMGIDMGEGNGQSAPHESSTSSKEAELTKQLEDQRRETERLRDEMHKSEMTNLRKEMTESMQGLQVWMQKNQQDAEKERQKEREHQKEIESLRLEIAKVGSRTRQSEDERLVSLASEKLIGKDMSLSDLYFRMMQGGQIPGIQSGRPTLAGQVTSPQQAAADLARRLEESQQQQA